MVREWVDHALREPVHLAIEFAFLVIIIFLYTRKPYDAEKKANKRTKKVGGWVGGLENQTIGAENSSAKCDFSVVALHSTRTPSLPAHPFLTPSRFVYLFCLTSTLSLTPPPPAALIAGRGGTRQRVEARAAHL